MTNMHMLSQNDRFALYTARAVISPDDGPHYYTLQILRSAVLYDGTSRAGDMKSGSVLSRGSIISKRPHVFECIHVTCAFKLQYSYSKVI